MQKENVNVVSCPPCGENVGLPTKRGAYKATSLMSPSIGPADPFLRKGGRKAFTLIELLVVVLIIGILAAVAVPQYQKAVARSRFVELKTLATALSKAEEVYYLANGEYTTHVEDLDIDMPSQQGINCVLFPERATCYIKIKNVEMGYTSFFLHITQNAGARWCFAFDTNENSITNQICKMETGTTSPHSTTDLGAVRWQY